MKHEKIVKRENGIQYLICVNFLISSYGRNETKYMVEIYYREKGKRNWLNIDRDIYDHDYRALSMEKREEYDNKNMLRFVSKDEIYDAKIELWNLLKPQMQYFWQFKYNN